MNDFEKLYDIKCNIEKEIVNNKLFKLGYEDAMSIVMVNDMDFDCKFNVDFDGFTLDDYKLFSNSITKLLFYKSEKI